MRACIRCSPNATLTKVLFVGHVSRITTAHLLAKRTSCSTFQRARAGCSTQAHSAAFEAVVSLSTISEASLLVYASIVVPLIAADADVATTTTAAQGRTL